MPTKMDNKRVLARFGMVFDGHEFQIVPHRLYVISRRVAEIREVEDLLPGGMIVMSTDVNATAGKGWLGKLKSWTKTMMNRVKRVRRVDEAVQDVLRQRGESSGWTIGRMLRGRYHDKDTDTLFNEKSFTIDISGVPYSTIKDVGYELAKKFNQKCVLAVDHATGRRQLLKLR